MSEDPSGWSLTESDPQDDLYSLDSETLSTLKPIHALIFLFKYVGQGEGKETSGIEVDPLESGVWFANQVINNSCGTLAALNAVMNIPAKPAIYPDEAIELGSELDNLKEFGAGMSAMDLGHILSSSDRIREVHNSFSKSSPFSMDPNSFPDREKEDAYHFVAYLPVNGVLYELDGLRGTPVMHAAVEDGDGSWLDQARETIEGRIGTYPPGAVMFNLLAVRSAAIPRLEKLLADTQTETAQRLEAEQQLEAERVKAERGEVENALRRHNLLPTVFALFKAMGESGMMDKAVEEARAKGKERKEKAKARGEAEDA